ncbi:hypothetical protein [Vibrio splendidus]|uniref:hypothetical protein n=1 Tax=Vibrio splendidus TaxID=29497 RepID=UPI000D3ABB1A|nr:hypothetical protein [Vibrio splendidus]PTO85996.1 hypothetical protein CWO29_19575 [Vibrio splendidus]
MNVLIGSANDLCISLEDICEFYEKNWNRKIALSNSDFSNWQFNANPENNGNGCCVALEGDKIVAVMGLTERSFLLDGKVLKGAELTTWIVQDGKRNLGLGPKMIDFLQDRYQALSGMGITEQALPIYLRKGFKFVKSIPRFIKVVNNTVVKKYGQTSPLAIKLNKLKKSDTDYIILDFDVDTVNHIYTKFCKDNNLFIRNFNWLSWRYSEHPSFDYKCVVIGKGIYKCVLVYRVDYLSDMTIMHCTDIFGDSEAYLSALSYLESIAVNQNIDIIDFYSTNTSVNAHFIYQGWFPTLDFDFFDFPHLFHPIEIRKPTTTSLVLWCKEQTPSFYDVGKMYITKQDCDFDRPTLNNL